MATLSARPATVAGSPRRAERPTILNIHSFWEASAAKAVPTIPFEPVFDGPLPEPISAYRSPRRTAARFDDFFNETSSSAFLPRASLGPLPTTAVLAGPRSPRRGMASARPRANGRIETAVTFNGIVTPALAKRQQSGGLIVQQPTGSFQHARPRVTNEQLVDAHKRLQSLIETRFKQMRRCFRMIDEDATGFCSRVELKYMLNTMFNLQIPEPILDRLIDLADYDKDGHISFAEFCRVFTSTDLLNMKDTLEAGVKGGQRAVADKVPSPTLNEDEIGALGVDMRTEIMKRYTSLKVAFKLMDADKSGYLDISEIKSALIKWKIPFDDKRVDRLFQQGDFNADGKIHYGEFVDALSRDTPLLRALSYGMKVK